MFPAAVLLGTVAVFFTGMGMLGLASPKGLVAPFGVTLTTSAARAETRAVYGGFGVAVGALLCALAWPGDTVVTVVPGVANQQHELRAGVALALAVSLAGMAAGRLVSRLVDGPYKFYPVWFYFWVELGLAGMLFKVVQHPDYSNGWSLHSSGERSYAAEFVRSSQTDPLHFSLQQTLRAPSLTAPVRLPRCLSTKNITLWLEHALQQEYQHQLSSNVTVGTSLVQRLDECRFLSFITYTGSPDLKHRLADAANAQQLCKKLPSYCQQAFPSGSEHTLVSTSGTDTPLLPPVIDLKCKKFTFDQKLDHFSQEETRTFSQVYWTCAAAWPEDKQTQEQSGHIIVFLGNESPLGTPSQPIVFENARRLNALVLLVEHRYYGSSKPFKVEQGKLDTSQYKWLTMEQVMEDTATVLAHIRSQLDVPPAVPAIVIGGSYGGMIASYHRVVKPHVFAAAVAASAPVQYIMGTPMWQDSSNRYHKFIATSLETFGGKACRKTVRNGIAKIRALAATPAGRCRVSEAFQLCGKQPLPDRKAVFALQMDIMGAYQGYAQVNNQPSLLGQVDLACQVALEAKAAGADDLQSVAAVSSYFNHNGSNTWCYGFNASDNIWIPDSDEGYNSYSYQCCTQGTVMSSVLPASGSKHTLSPEFEVNLQQVRRDCEAAFGKALPEMKAPWFARHIRQLLRAVGGVVMTNGDCDGWAGGSFQHDGWREVPDRAAFTGREKVDMSTAGLTAGAAAAAAWQLLTGAAGVHQTQPTGVVASSRRRLLTSSVWQAAAGASSTVSRRGPARLAFVTYKGASHCTDTHTNTWDTPDEPPAWKQQRAQAMDLAAGFAADFRRQQLQQQRKESVE